MSTQPLIDDYSLASAQQRREEVRRLLNDRDVSGAEAGGRDYSPPSGSDRGEGAFLQAPARQQDIPGTYQPYRDEGYDSRGINPRFSSTSSVLRPLRAGKSTVAEPIQSSSRRSGNQSPGPAKLPDTKNHGEAYLKEDEYGRTTLSPLINADAAGTRGTHLLRFDNNTRNPTFVRRDELGSQGRWNSRSPRRDGNDAQERGLVQGSQDSRYQFPSDGAGDGKGDETQKEATPVRKDGQITKNRREKKTSTQDVKSVDQWNFDKLKHNPEQDKLQNVWGSRAETLSSSYSLFSAVTTMMITATNVRVETTEETRESLGLDNIEILTGIMTYACLPFFALMAMKWNNYFAERLYYKFLKRGVIVDFPLSDYTVWFKRCECLLFIIYCVLFLVYSFTVLILVKAALGHILIFVNNFGIGVGLYWYYQQSIELRFISLTRYIETYKDAEGDYYNIDPCSLHDASKHIDRLQLAECPQPSYTHYMRNQFYRIKGVSSSIQWRNIIMLYFVIGFVAALSIIYVFYLGRIGSGTRWTDKVNPCTRACVLESNGFTVSTNTARCQMCVCRCLSYLRELGAQGDCVSNLVVPGCVANATCAADCSTLNSQSFV